MALIISIGHSLLLFTIGSVNNIYEKQFFDIPINEAFIVQILRTIFNGSAAVAFFFVISGYFVNFSLDKSSFNISRVIKYVLKRILRIYPVYLFSLIISSFYLLYFHTYKTYPLASKWYLMWFHFKPFPKLILNHLFFIDTSMNTVAWALAPIVLFSFFAPLFYYFYKKKSIKINLFCLFLLLILSFILRQNNSIKYLFTFYIGLIAPKLKTFFANFVKKLSISTNKLGMFFIIGLLMARPLFLNNEILVKLIESISILVILLTIITNKNFFLNRLGKNKILVFFGKISYSFYLINFLVLYIIATFFLENTKFLLIGKNLVLVSMLIGILSVLITIPISVFSYFVIEKNVAKFS